MGNEHQNKKPGLVLRKKCLEEMEALGLNINEYISLKRLEMQKRWTSEMEHELKKNPHLPKQTGHIALNDNVDNLGFERRFMTREDAEFLLQQIQKWEDENSIWEALEQTAEDRERWIQTLALTGVRYDMKNIGVTLFFTWAFGQTNFDNGPSNIEYSPLEYYYNHYSKDFREINDEDYFEIDFSV